MVKKIIFIFFTALFFTGCSASRDLKVVRDDVQSKYLKEKFYYENNSNSTQFLMFQMDKKYLEGNRPVARRIVLENHKISEDEQVNLIKKLESFQHEDDRYFCFEINLLEPLLKEDQNFRFLIKDAKNNNYIQDIYKFNYKFGNINYWGFSWPGYNYTWMIKTTIPMAKKSFELENKPVELIVTFPNGSERHYLILEK